VAEHIVLVDDGWAGIAAALAAAQPGDTVRIAAGQFRGGDTLPVPSGVSLIGDEGNQLVYTGSETAILIDKARDVRVSGLSLRGYEGMADVGGEGETDDQMVKGLIRIAVSVSVRISGNRIVASAKRRNGISVVGSRAVIVERNRVNGARRGISFWSSAGEIMGNDCWDNSLDGIALFCNLDSLGDPSKALILDNQCHENSSSGIIVSSSESEAVAGNNCWGNGWSGITLERDPGNPDVPSHAPIHDNRCHNNKMTGIVLLASESEAIARNNCCGNHHYGIGLFGGFFDRFYYSRARISGNLCIENRLSGILISSPACSEIVGNDCWGNGESGIGIVSHQRFPSIPSHALICDNRCHDNKEMGIGLFSSESDAIAGNDCWGNGSHGIVLKRDPGSPHAPSHALIRSNHCHDNKQTGIILASSTSGAIAGNDCWGNGINGIAIERDTDSLDAPSHALIRDNRLADNRGAAIRFLGSTGRAQGNRSRGNGINSPEFKEEERSLIPTPEEPFCPDNDVDPKLDLAGPYLAAVRLPLEQLIATGQQRQPPSATGLAEFLTTGCHGCFRAFWIGHRNANDRRKPEKEVETDPRHWHISIADEPILKQKPANAQGARAALTAQIEAWRRKSDEAGPGTAHWAVLVSPDEGDIETVAASLRQSDAKRASGDFVAGGRMAPPLILSLAGGEVPLRSQLSAALQARGGSLRQAQIGALLRLRTFWAGLVLPLLAGLGVMAMGWQGALWDWQTRLIGVDPVADWKGPEWFSAASIALLVMYVFGQILRSHLPSHLRGGAASGHSDGLWNRFQRTRIPDLIDWIDPVAIVPERWRARWRDMADLNWQRRQLLRGNASVAPLIIRDISGWQTGDIEWLGRLSGAMRAQQPLIGLLHIDGRLSLRPLIIDPADAPWRAGFELFLSDDEERLRIAAMPAPVDAADVVGQFSLLAKLKDSEAKELSSALGNDIWSALDLLPCLPLASAPTARLSLQRVPTENAQNLDLIERLQAAADFFGNEVRENGIDRATIDKLFEWSKSSTAIRSDEFREGSQYYERLTGRVAARRRVAALVRSLWPQAADWREYVAASLRFGIWVRVCDLTRRLPRIGTDPQALLLAMRDFDGLRFLGEEYQALLAAGCVVHGEARFDRAWRDLGAVMPALPAAQQHDALFARYIGAEHACHRRAESLVAAQGEAIRRWLGDPISLAAADDSGTASEAFCRTSARMIITLRNMEPRSRHLRLTIDKELLWLGLPPSLLATIETLAFGPAQSTSSLATLFAAASSRDEIAALVRLHALAPERTLYALSHAALRSIERRFGRAPDHPEAVAALIPVGHALIRVRELWLSRPSAVGAPTLSEDFAVGAAAAVTGGEVAAAFLAEDGAAETLLDWLTPSRDEQLANFEAQLAIDLRDASEASAPSSAPQSPPASPAPTGQIKVRFDAATSMGFSLPGTKSKPS
jgi:nitrous oxidase accessory protein NosD